MEGDNRYIRVRIATLDRETKQMTVQIKDYDTEIHPLVVVLKTIREFFHGTGHDIVSLTSKNISLREFVEGR